MAKHRRGWGSVAKIAGRDGWWVRYRKLRDDGARVRTWAYGGEKVEDAEKRLGELWVEEEAKAGRPTQTGRLADFLQTYLPLLAARVAPSSYKTTKEHLLHAAEWFGETEVRDLRRADVEASFADVQKQRARKAAAAKKAGRTKIPGPLKPMTLRNKRTALSMCFKTAIDHGMFAENPCTGLRLPRPHQLALAYLGPAEVRRIYAACAAREPRYRDLVVVLGETGMRLGEALSLP
jgi:integrase